MTDACQTQQTHSEQAQGAGFGNGCSAQVGVAAGECCATLEETGAGVDGNLRGRSDLSAGAENGTRKGVIMGAVSEGYHRPSRRGEGTTEDYPIRNAVASN